MCKCSDISAFTHVSDSFVVGRALVSELACISEFVGVLSWLKLFLLLWFLDLLISLNLL